MEGDTREEPVKDLNELQNADWVRRRISLHQAPQAVLEITRRWSDCVSFLFTRHGSGCRWCEIYEMAWSWRRFRNASTTRCPLNTSSLPTKCWWMTSAPNVTNCEKWWWGFQWPPGQAHIFLLISFCLVYVKIEISGVRGVECMCL